ncbi:MAG: hypothetical protein J6A59_10015 [Lachnospiraceae bacterium]|nr:hypothetical protein [Lachnospiraceae bacterium]
MLTYFVYIVLIAALLTAFIFVYDIICYILIKSKLKGTASKLTDDDAKRIANESGGANLWLRIIIARYKHKMKSKTSGEAKTLKKFAKSTNKVNFAVSAIMILSSVMLTAYGAGLYQLDYVLSHITTLFHDEDCTCYAKCTRNPEDDMKCSYELIFGNAEYEKLLYGMNLTPMEKELFLTFSDGKAQGEFIIKHLNDDMVETYKAALKNKGIKRLNNKSKLYSEMTDDELHDDLAKLLADYKKNGVNPNCTSCKDSNSFEVALGCQGLEHWKPGWTWQEIGDNDGTGSGGSTNLPGVSTMGNATGQYAVQLDDGMYYWYHQDGDHGCKCVHCGNWSAAQWAGPGKVKHAFGKDGCAVYSLAIGISNLYGAEITPAVIFEDLGSPITNGEITTVPMYFGGDNGRSIYYNAVANRLAQKYNLDVSSIWTSEVPRNLINFIDDILAKGGIVWGSWVDSQCQWCGNGSTHFMCIRKTDGTNYYCFTSCGGKCTSKGGKDGAIETMNYPIPKATCVSAFVGGKPIFGFVNPNATSGGGKVELADGLAQNAMAFYNKYNGPMGQPVKQVGTTGAYLYDGIPWDAANAYTLNIGAVDSYINKYLGKKTTSSMANDNHCSSSALETDGVKCIDFAAPPILAFVDINDGGSPIRYEVSDRPKKVCAILKDGSGKTYYLPLRCEGDAKGHTWPGGLAQTFLSHKGQTNGKWNFDTDGGHIEGPIIGKDVTSINDIKNGYSSVTYRSKDGTSNVYPQLNLEVHEDVHNALSGYKFTGFISWK